MELFKDLIPSLNLKLEHLIDDNPDSEPLYNAFLVNRAYGYGEDTILFANRMNIYPNLDKKMQYDFYWYALDKRKRYNKWLKPEEVNRIEIIKEYYGYSDKKAKEASRILTDEQFQIIEERLSKGGINK